MLSAFCTLRRRLINRQFVRLCSAKFEGLRSSSPPPPTFIELQHAERDIVLPIPSVLPFVQCQYCAETMARIVKRFLLSARDIAMVFPHYI